MSINFSFKGYEVSVNVGAQRESLETNAKNNKFKTKKESSPHSSASIFIFYFLLLRTTGICHRMERKVHP